MLDANCRFCRDAQYEGMYVFDANKPILRNLRNGDGPLAGSGEHRAILFQEKSYVHSYPHCWRCAALIYKPVSSWFRHSVTKIKPRLLGSTSRSTGFLRMSRMVSSVSGCQRATGRSTAASGVRRSVWVSDDPKYPRVDVYGSLEELKADFGDYPRDKDGNVNATVRGSTTSRASTRTTRPARAPHAPYQRRRSTGWFESVEQVRDSTVRGTGEVRQRFPADYIVEYIGQTRPAGSTCCT